jgi:hypothetical protein
MAPPGAVAVAAEVQARLLRVLEDDGEAEGLVEDAVGAVALLPTDCGDSVGVSSGSQASEGGGVDAGQPAGGSDTCDTCDTCDAGGVGRLRL